ncbi:hypothetical protein GSI_13375 [Ganoderma sinense ZZ0214-1]|uniref:Carboxylesterase type B domain-containing protein n=1 Tax=Ganoderma sinense ZZ0214-1 TaxID=1077348 RepID=A0A2G8RVD8_9APHY|nr:hypothetical protein GSI_13375 [Ganoderma sinense ZZ0214-1]
MFSSHLTTLLPLALWLGRFAAVRCGTLPTVQLDQATVYGIINGSVTSFFNIPFAEPPIGDLRLRLPKPIDNYNGTINATQVGAQCIQQIPPLREDMPAEMLQDVIAPFKEPVRNAVLAGRIAHVPFITGDSLDEGTIFASGAFNITTDAEFLDYMRSLYFPGASGAEVAPLLDLYPDDPAQGSPFGTGDENQLAPMFKRVAAFEGDFLFQSQRRSLLTLRSSKQHAWSYLVDRNPFPGVGIPHGNDILALSRGEDFLDYIIQFVATLDPDGGSNRTRYDPASRRVLSVLDGEEPLAIEQDDAREAAMEAVVALSFKYPL